MGLCRGLDIHRVIRVIRRDARSLDYGSCNTEQPQLAKTNVILRLQQRSADDFHKS